MNLNDVLKDIQLKTRITIRDHDADRELYSGLRGQFSLNKYAGIRLDSEVVNAYECKLMSGRVIIINIRRPRK